MGTKLTALEKLVGPLTVSDDPDEGMMTSGKVPLAVFGGHACAIIFQGLNDAPFKDITAGTKWLVAAPVDVLHAATPHVVAYRDDMRALQRKYEPKAKQRKPSANVWDDVTFGTDLYVQRRTNGDDEDGVYFSLECNCAWEIEHGLQIVLRAGVGVTKVGAFDGHETNSDAYNDRSLTGVIYKR